MSSREIYNPEFDEWRPAVGYPGYLVSATGHIYGPGRHGIPKLLKPSRTNHGHLYVSLYRGGVRHREYIHRLVAESFVPNPNNCPIVRHLNDYPDDNDASNLAWGTQRDNIIDMRRARNDYVFSDEDRESAYEKRRTPIKAVYLQTGEERLFPSQQEASRILGVSQSTISGIIAGKPGRRSGCGYTFAKQEVEQHE